MRRYEFIDHTADLGITVKGENLADLFASGGYALFDIILENIGKIKTTHHSQIKVPGGHIEDVFFDWMRELLSKFNLDNLAFKQFDIKKVDESGLEAVARGEKIDPSRHPLKTEIKAVTYHGLKVQRHNNLWEAQLIFDV